MAVDLYTNSRFQDTPLVLADDTEVYGPWVPPRFLSEPLPAELVGGFRVTPDLAGRPDLISDRLYGTPFLDWVLIAFNNPKGSFNWPESGIIIRFPVTSVVLREVD